MDTDSFPRSLTSVSICVHLWAIPGAHPRSRFSSARRLDGAQVNHWIDPAMLRSNHRPHTPLRPRIFFNARTVVVTGSERTIHHCPRSIRGLGASRTISFRFRIGFVFTVCHGFLFVVSQYSLLVQLKTEPSQNRTCAVNASGSQPTLLTWHYVVLPIAIKSFIRPGNANG